MANEQPLLLTVDVLSNGRPGRQASYNQDNEGMALSLLHPKIRGLVYLLSL